ncbi:MAG: hypothetical protein CSB55_07455 [Candidatus Cloacimonadota bacterium]|nr:MAG: hypothetical protein CSB55_07455 [Candidatus Cloacimonadota bacterium]
MEKIKKANNRIMAGTAIIILFLFLFFKFTFKFNDGKVIAKINNIDIPYTEYWAYTSQISRKLSDRDKMLALDWIVDQNIIGLYAEKSEEIKKQLDPIFAKEKLYAEKDLLLRIYNIEKVDKKVKANEQQLKEFYFGHKFYNLYYLAIGRATSKANVKAKQAYMKLEQGNKFADVFAEFADESLQKTEGKLGVFLESEIPEPFKNHIKELKFEESFSEPFKGDYGTYILYRGNDKTFEEIKDEVKIRVERELKQQMYNDLYENIKNGLTVNKEFLENLPKDPDPQTPVITLKDKKTVIDFKSFSSDLNELFQLADLNKTESDILIEKAYILGVQEQIYRNALELKLEKSEKFKQEWRRIAVNLKETKSQKTIRWVLEHVLAKDINVTKKEMLDYYMLNRKEFRKSALYKLQKTVVDNKSEADSIYAKARRKIKFSKLVLKYSVEENVNRTLGRTPYLTKEELGEDWKTIKEYHPGEIVTPLETENGYVVYKILDFQKGAQLTYEQAEKPIYNMLFVEKLTSALEKIQEEYDIKVEKFYNVVLEENNEDKN